jgi:hypothetical protein
MAPERSRPNQVGLGFRAAERRRGGRVDVDGALWIDTVARALEDIEFAYVGLDPEVAALHPGGRIGFREMANGVVLVDRWSLRLVTGAVQSTSTLGGGEIVRARSVRLRVQEVGGELARATWPDGQTWSAALGTLRLHAITRRGQPAAGTVVRLADTDYQGRADSAGDLQIRDLLPGPYVAEVVDPRLSALDIPLVTSVKVVAARDSTTQARLEVETADDYVARRCAVDRPVTGSAWLLGRVIAPDGKPAKDASWKIRDAFGSALVEGGRVGSDGLFHWCELTLDKNVAIEAMQGQTRADVRRALTDRLTVVRLELKP